VGLSAGGTIPFGVVLLSRIDERYNPMPVERSAHILINGLSIGSGGGYTVGRELFRYLAIERPAWRVTMAAIGGNTLHEGFRSENVPGNGQVHWAPATATGQVGRTRYETGELTAWARANGVTAVLQLNGMIVPGMPAPTLSHCQDPWPYRNEAWSGWKAPIVAYLKRRRNARAFREAAVVGFTSHYLKDLMIGRLGITPRRAEVFYNGLPQEMIDRAGRPLPDWVSRPMEVVSVSNVNEYKRQELVIRALPALLKRPGVEGLIYRIAGHVEGDYRRHLEGVAKALGVGERVTFEGRVSDERVRELLTRARAFVLMSVCESFGIPAIEAMSFGAPVVTADCCAMPEVCGRAAILSPVDDVNALVENLARVLTSADQAEALRRAGAEQARRFSWADTARQMAAAIEHM
jgi:glycosyltransferase involved in cell wall biosynthesis